MHITTHCQGMLEEKLGKLYINLSLHQTLDQLLRERYDFVLQLACWSIVVMIAPPQAPFSVTFFLYMTRLCLSN